MNILITGGAGFIGSKLVYTLALLGHQVRILDNLNQQVHSQPALTKETLQSYAEFMEGDIRSESDVAKALVNIDTLVHLVAETGVGQSMYEIVKHTDINVTGTANVLQTLVNNSDHRVSRIVLSSSRAVYGEGKYWCSDCNKHVYPSARQGTALVVGQWEPKCPYCSGVIEASPTDEESLKMPPSIYAITKSGQEELLQCISNILQVPTMILRYFNVYGEGQTLGNPYTGILTTFFTRLKHGKRLHVYEDGQESRDFVYVDDVVQATRLAIHTNCEGIVNVGSGQRTTILDVANEVIQAYGQGDKPLVSGEYRLGDIRHCFADITKAQQQLGYCPQITLAEGIKRFVAWADTQTPTDNTAQAHEELRKRGLLGQAAITA